MCIFSTSWCCSIGVQAPLGSGVMVAHVLDGRLVQQGALRQRGGGGTLTGMRKWGGPKGVMLCWVESSYHYVEASITIA